MFLHHILYHLLKQHKVQKKNRKSNTSPVENLLHYYRTILYILLLSTPSNIKIIIKTYLFKTHDANARAQVIVNQSWYVYCCSYFVIKLQHKGSYCSCCCCGQPVFIGLAKPLIYLNVKKVNFTKYILIKTRCEVKNTQKKGKRPPVGLLF